MAELLPAIETKQKAKITVNKKEENQYENNSIKTKI